MKLLITIFLLFTGSLLLRAQVVLLNNSNLAGFTFNSVSNLTANFTSGGVTTTLANQSGAGSASLDSTLNLTGYDSITVYFDMSRCGCGGACVNNLFPTGSFTYSYTTTNTSVLSLQISQFCYSVTIKNLKIIGYPSPLGVTEMALPQASFYAFGNTIFIKGEAGDHHIELFDMSGKQVYSGEIRNELCPGISKGIYTAVLYDEKRAVLNSRKLSLTE